MNVTPGTRRRDRERARRVGAALWSAGSNRHRLDPRHSVAADDHRSCPRLLPLPADGIPGQRLRHQRRRHRRFLALGRKSLVLGACTDQARISIRAPHCSQAPGRHEHLHRQVSAPNVPARPRATSQAAARRENPLVPQPSFRCRTDLSRATRRPDETGSSTTRARPSTVWQLLRPLPLPYGVLLRDDLWPALGARASFHRPSAHPRPPDTTAEEAAVRDYLFGGLGSILAPVLLVPEARPTVGLVSARLACASLFTKSLNHLRLLKCSRTRMGRCRSPRPAS